jgi:putative addiction module killer protein
MTPFIEIRHYADHNGQDVFDAWFASITDARTKAKIGARISRLAFGNFGDCRPLREGVWELRIDWGPGYRVYYSVVEKAVALLLCGGDKRRQSSDIERAIGYLKDYRRRTDKR